MGGGLVPVLVQVRFAGLTSSRRIGWRRGQAPGPHIHTALPPVPTDVGERL